MTARALQIHSEQRPVDAVRGSRATAAQKRRLSSALDVSAAFGTLSSAVSSPVIADEQRNQNDDAAAVGASSSSDEALRRSFARQVRLSSSPSPSLGVSLDTSVQLLHSAQVSAREQLFANRYNIREECYARDSTLQPTGAAPREFLVGLDTLELALDAVIARPMATPLLCPCAQPVIAVQALPSSGVRSLLRGWCADREHRLNLVTYAAYSAQAEATPEFFALLMQYCATMWPCVLLVDRICARTNGEWAAALYRALFAAYLRLFDKPPGAGTAPALWLVLVDHALPATMCAEWSFLETTVVLPTFTGSYPAERMRQSIRRSLHMRLAQRHDAETLWNDGFGALVDQLCAEHSAQLQTARELDQYVQSAYAAPVRGISTAELRTLHETAVDAARILPQRAHFDQALEQVRASRVRHEQRVEQQRIVQVQQAQRAENERLWSGMEARARGQGLV